METSKNSTRQLTLDELISSQEGSPANPTLSLESERERRTNATCGQRCCALFENAPRATSWAKTFAALLVGMEGWSSRRCALTWRLVGTPYNRSYFQLQVSGLPTEEIECGLLRTPAAQEPGIRAERLVTKDGEPARIGERAYDKHTGRLCQVGLQQQVQMGLLLTHTTREEVMDTDKFKERMEKYDNGTTVPNLATQVLGMLPTPTSSDYNTPRSQEAWDKAKEKHGDALQNPLRQMAEFGMLPTPCAQEGYKSTGAEKQDSLTKRTRQMTGSGSQLSPLFVEEMMGFPRNWTASPFQSGDENP